MQIRRSPSSGTYPKPKNFAERMMNALENECGLDVISWYEHGKENLIAINSKTLKNSDILNANFQGIRYAAFVRNLSRWGFRKVHKAKLPDGVAVYRNSLFQKDNPHLVRHMKIDSDVQDIFGQHQKSSAQASPDPAPTAMLGQSQEQFTGSQLPDASVELLCQMLLSQEGRGQALPCHQQQQQQQLLNGNTLGSLQKALGLSGQVAAANGRSADDILREIVALSQEYLVIVSPSPATPFLQTIKSLLTLLVSLGTDFFRNQQEEEEQQRQQQQPNQGQSHSIPLLQELLLSMSRQSNQQQQPALAFPASTGSAGSGGGFIEELRNTLQRQAGQQLQQQSQLQTTGIGGMAGISPQLLMQLVQQRQEQMQQKQPSADDSRNAS